MADFIKLSDSVFGLQGDLVFNTVNSLSNKAEEMIYSATKAMTIDCSKVTLCDSAGIALLVQWYKEAKKRGLEINFSLITKQMHQLIHLMSLESTFCGDLHGKK